MAKVVQFPLSLCFSSTAHKQQGLTIYKPNSLITDLKSVFTGAQAYVILSRVETDKQMFILDELPVKKIYPNASAMKELQILEEKSVNKQLEDRYNKFTLHLAFLNIRSLPAHFIDLKKDNKLMKSNLLLLGQTCLLPNETHKYRIPGYSSHFNSVGNGKGIASYATDNFNHQSDITETTFQLSKHCHTYLDVICVYRSSNDKQDKILAQIKTLFNKEKATIILGDFNVCYLKNPSNKISQELKKLKFKQLIREPTHEEGGCIDHLYLYTPERIAIEYLLEIEPIYYSDHDCLILHLNINKKKTQSSYDGTKKTSNSKIKRKITESNNIHNKRSRPN